MLQKHCVKDEQRAAHRITQQREKARSARELSPGRQPLDPTAVRSLKLTDAPDAYYDTDCGSNKVSGSKMLAIPLLRVDSDASRLTFEQTLQHDLEGFNTCRGAFSSTKDRFASTAAYRASTFASVVKEPYSDPNAIGPGTYRSKKRAIQVKKKEVPTPGYMSKAARFEKAQAQVSAVLSLGQPSGGGQSPRKSPVLENAGGFVQQRPATRGGVLSTTPRFKSAVFPGWWMVLM